MFDQHSMCIQMLQQQQKKKLRRKTRKSLFLLSFVGTLTWLFIPMSWIYFKISYWDLFMQIFNWENCTHYKWNLVSLPMHHWELFFFFSFFLINLADEDHIEWRECDCDKNDWNLPIIKGGGKKVQQRSLVLLININEQQMLIWSIQCYI